MARYAIKHLPSGKFLYEDEGGSFLVDEEDGFITYGDKKTADEIFELYLEDDLVRTENGDFPTVEFKVVELC